MHINFWCSVIFIGIGMVSFIVISAIIFAFVLIGTVLRSLAIHKVAVDFAFATIALLIMQLWYILTTGKSIEEIEIAKMVAISLIGAGIDSYSLGIFKRILSCGEQDTY